MSDAFSYIFRFCCDPDFNGKQEMEALEQYVDDAQVDDVAVFANVEEMNTGHMSFDEQEKFITLLHETMDKMRAKGITVSVNQWHSIMHADLGKTLSEGQNFRLMVDKNGRQASLCVCPLCENWQNYIAQLYARYAELDPSILWVEDDFRLHNHAPLDWGGCFCDEHMRLYSEAAGKKLTRDEFVRGVLQPGVPHPYRKIWLDVSRDTMLSAARAIAQGIRSRSSSVKVGLMSSVPFVHAAEGRDWKRLLNTLGSGQPPVNRAHLPGYQETVPSEYLRNMNMVSMMTCALLPQGTEEYPELENYPYSLFAKSRKFTRYQLLCALALNVQGITLDLYDLNGNGIVFEDGYQDMLRSVKPVLSQMNETGAFAQKRIGVHVLYNERSAYTLHTKAGQSMEELYPQEVFFAGLLPAMGVPFLYDDDVMMVHQVVAVSGQVLRNYTKDQIAHLFANNFVILSGDAVDTLCDMELSSLAGVEKIRWLRQDQGHYTMEQVVNGKAYRGRNQARASAVISCSDVLDVTYLPGVDIDEYTAFYDSFGRCNAHGETVINGHIMIYPFGHFSSPTDIPPMLLSAARQEILEDVMSSKLPMTLRQPYLAPYVFENDKHLFMYVINAATDDQDMIHLANVPDGMAQILCSEDGQWHRAEIANGILPVRLCSMETILIQWNKGENE